MSTIVKYKGNTIAVADNDTRTLLTNGKWLENNIEITSQTPTTATVAVSDTVDPAGGTVREITTGTAASDDVTYTTVNYNNATVVSFHSDTTKSLRTGGTFAESDFEVVSDEPGLTNIEVTKTADIKGGTIEDIKVVSEANRFFDASYPKGNIYNNNTTSIEPYAINGRTNITGIYAPAVTTIGEYSFRGCSSLKSVYLPSLSGVNTGSYGPFYENSSLTGLVLPNFNLCPVYMCRYNYKLEYIDFLGGAFNTQAFQNCYMLKTIVIRSPTMVDCYNAGSLSNTPLTGYGGTYEGHIYVPNELIESYQTATNWSTMYANYSEIFQPIEGSEYETHYADGTLISEYNNLQPPTDAFFSDILDQSCPRGQIHTNASSMRAYAAYKRTGITKIIDTDVTILDNTKSFQECTGLKSVYFPNAIFGSAAGGVDRGQASFQGCTSLEEVTLGEVTRIPGYAFYQCSTLKTLNFDTSKITSVGGYGFSGCSNLTNDEIDSSNVTSLGNYAFQNCLKITEFDLSNTTSIGNHAFDSSGVKKIILTHSCSLGTAALGYAKLCQLLVLRTITSLASDSLRQDGYSLSGDNRCVFDLGDITSMANRALYQTNPKAVVLRDTETVCTLSSVSGSTTCLPLNTSASQAYTVYVPQALMSDYQNATNWSTLLSGSYQVTLAALEGSKYEDPDWYLEEE